MISQTDASESTQIGSREEWGRIKACTKCGKIPGLDGFYKNSARKDGLSSRCKVCINETSREHYGQFRGHYIAKAAEWKRKNSRKARAYFKNRRLAHRASKDAIGQCDKCTSPKLVHSQLCETHWFECASSRHFGTVEHAGFLKVLAERQSWLCAYTGEHLTPGQNMSLDHVVSVHDNPRMKHDLQNLQWVTIDVNRAKGKLSHLAFAELVRLIASRLN